MTGFQISSGNAPRPRPGAYLITNTVTGLQYVGSSDNVLRRSRVWQRGGERGTLLGKAINKYGIANFRLTPLYYAIDSNLLALREVESQLIEEWQCVTPNGYNRIVRANDSYHRAAINKGISSDATRAKMSAAQKARLKDPENLKKLSAAIKKGCTPERNAKIRQSRKGQIWITDEFDNKTIPSTEPIPKGWRRGKIHRKTPPASFGKRQSEIRRSQICITNGAIRRRHPKGQPIPKGWRRGWKLAL